MGTMPSSSMIPTASPLDLTALILTEQGLSVDEAGFDKAMQEQKERARNAAAIDAGDWQVVNDGSAVRFVGYDTSSAPRRSCAIVR